MLTVVVEQKTKDGKTTRIVTCHDVQIERTGARPDWLDVICQTFLIADDETTISRATSMSVKKSALDRQTRISVINESSETVLQETW